MAPTYKIFIIAGEDSGDLHASNLMLAMTRLVGNIAYKGVGGDKMQAAGMELVAHVRDINFMGFKEVVQNLGTIRRLFKTVKTEITHWQPDLVILVDYPGFNLRIAKYVKGLGVPVGYYISPQLWAWKKGRIKKVRKYVDQMMVILPFEADFYRREGLEVSFVGHPLLDVIQELPPKNPGGKKVALLPGSRKQEITKILPVLLPLASLMPDYTFVVAGAPSQTLEFYQAMTEGLAVEIKMNRTYELLKEADFAVVTSGTATLETALFRVPQVVVYKTGGIFYHLMKRMIQVPFISLVNLIMQRKVVEELIQDQCTTETVKQALEALAGTYQKIQEDYEELVEVLGEKGASERAAKCMLSLLTAPAPTA